MKKRRLWFAIPFAALLIVACAAALAPPRHEPPPHTSAIGISARTAPGDSIWFIAYWAAPELGRQHRPIDGYTVAWTLAGDTLAFHEVEAPRDSIIVERAAAGDSIGPYRVAVRTRDVAGTLSLTAAHSPEWYTSTDAEAPPPPSSVQLLERISGVPDATPRLHVYLSDKVHECDLEEYTQGGWPGPEPEYCDSVG